MFLTLAAVLILCACSSQDEQRTVINFWAMGSEGEIVKALLPAFEQQNPGIHVRVQQIPWSAAHEKLLTAYAGDNIPDVFQLGNTWVPEFVALNAITPLDGWITRSRAFKRDDYFPGIMATNVMEETTFGIPWYVDTRLIFYRKDLLLRAGYAELPRTWADWIKAMHRIKALDDGKHHPIFLPINEWAAPVIFALQLDARLLKDEDQYGNFSDPQYRRAFEFYVNLFRQGLAPPITNAQISNLYQAFAAGEIAMTITGPWNLGEFRQRLPQAVQASWATAPLPAPDDRYPGVSLAGGASLVLSRTSTHQAAGWKLIEYLSAPAQQIQFYKLTGDLPASKTAWQDKSLHDDPKTHAFWDQLQNVEATPRIPEWQQIAQKIEQYAEAVVREDMSLSKALKALDQDTDRILEKRRWLLARKNR